jgi:hypothetical protein
MFLKSLARAPRLPHATSCEQLKQGGCVMELVIDVELSARDRSILRAVAGGRAELVWGSEPDLYLDGRFCCDQSAVHRLVRTGLIAPATEGAVGERLPALVTTAGRLELVA